MKGCSVMGSVAVLLGGGTLAGQDFFSLGFEGATAASARAGQVVRQNYGVVLSHVGVGPGAQAWSFGLTANGGAIAGATTAGTLADTVENGGLRHGGFEKTETIDPAKNGGKSGAISAVVLSFTERVQLLDNARSSIAKVDVDFSIPNGSSSAVLSFEDGLRGSGLPVKTAITQQGVTKTPRLDSLGVLLFAMPDCCTAPVNIAFSPSLIRGAPPLDDDILELGPDCTAGELVVTYTGPGKLPVYLNIVSRLTPESGGVQGWSFSIRFNGEGNLLSATTAGTAADRKENGGYWSQGFNKTEVIDPVRNGNRQGAVSAVVLSLTEGTILPLQGTESILALEVEVREQAEAHLQVVNGFRGSGQPVTSVVTVGGDSRAACNQSTASIRLKHEPPIAETIFIRGDANDDGKVDLADAIWIMNDLFREGRSGVCLEASDANDDEHLDASDAIYLIEYLFRAQLPPTEPFPFCGFDPTDRSGPGEEECYRTLGCH